MVQLIERLINIQNQPFSLHYQCSQLIQGVSTMTQHASTPQGQSNEDEAITRSHLFKSGTPAYQRMVNMIQNLVRAKTQQEATKCEQNEETNAQSGQDINHPIELQESSEIYQQEEDGPDKNEEVAAGPNELVFEQSDYSSQDKEQKKVEAQESQFVENCDQGTEEYLAPKKVHRNTQNKKKKNTSEPKSIPKRNTVVPSRTNTRSNRQRQVQQKPNPSETRNKNASRAPQAKVHRPSSPRSKPIVQKKTTLVPKHTPKKKVKQQDRYEEGTVMIRIKPENFSIPKSKAQKKQVNKPVVIEDDSSQQDAQQVMQKSKKPSIQWVQFRVVVPLAPSQRPKEKPRSSTRQQPHVEIDQIQPYTPKTIATRSKQMDVQMSFQNKVQKAKKSQGQIDLGSYTLPKLVEQVFIRGLISEQLFKGFKQNHSSYYTKDFLNKFEDKGLKKFNFKQIQFTPLDHRRLAELLMNLYPANYIINSESLPKDHSQGFIISSYGLDPKEYFEVYSQIDKISDIGWWSEIMSRHQVSIQQAVLRKKKEQEYSQKTKKRMKFT